MTIACQSTWCYEPATEHRCMLCVFLRWALISVVVVGALVMGEGKKIPNLRKAASALKGGLIR